VAAGVDQPTREENAMTNGQPTIGVALSGGGHRAALFGLGALLYLVDARKGPQLVSIASVSGSSLTNAYIGHTVDLSTVAVQSMWTHARDFACQVARRGTLWAAPLTWAYLASMAILVLLAVAASIWCPTWIIAVAWVIAVVVCGWLSQQRSAIAARAFDTTLFHKAPLTSMHGSVSHVLCATDLQTGQAVFFSDAFVYAWRCGWGSPGDLRMAQAAQASAALPGAFTVVSLPLRRFKLPEQRVLGRHPPKRFKLLDGGVYDNMGSEWLLDLGETIHDGVPPRQLATVDEAIVVNGSAGDDVIKRPWVRVPFLGEIASLLAVKDVMYRQTTAVRRRLLNIRYQIGQDLADIQTGARILDDALRGTTLQIDRSPFEIPDDYNVGSDALAARAAAAIARLGEENRQSWAAEADANRKVKTTLSRIDPQRAQSLIQHGYVLAMVNSHVLLDYPLLTLPAPERFGWLVTPTTTRAQSS
jgi:hypothetical protein